MPDPNDLLPPAVPDPAPAPAPAKRSARIVCEFCQCELDPQGNVLHRGESARNYLDLEDRLKKVTESVDILKAEGAELTRQLEAARTPPARRGFLDL